MMPANTVIDWLCIYQDSQGFSSSVKWKRICELLVDCEK